MPALDSAAIAQLELEVIKPVYYAYLDILGDPIRATTAGYAETLSGTGDSELDGSYSAIPSPMVTIGTVTHREGGSETVTCALSGILSIDLDLLTAIGDKANWQGRIARLWMRLRDENGTPQGAIFPYYTGYMVSIDVRPSPQSQTIELSIENYLSVFSEASQSSYISQKDFDSGDLSAQATIGAANGVRAGPASMIGVTPYQFGDLPSGYDFNQGAIF